MTNDVHTADKAEGGSIYHAGAAATLLLMAAALAALLPTFADTIVNAGGTAPALADTAGWLTAAFLAAALTIPTAAHHHSPTAAFAAASGAGLLATALTTHMFAPLLEMFTATTLLPYLLVLACGITIGRLTHTPHN